MDLIAIEERPRFGIDSTISFKLFWDFIKSQRLDTHSIDTSFQLSLLMKLEEHPEWLEDIDQDNIDNLWEMFELVKNTLVPFMSRKQPLLWGLTLPSYPVVIYGTDELYHLLEQKLNLRLWNVNSEQPKINEHQYLSIIYTFILQKVYGYTSYLEKSLSLSYIEKESGLIKYYKIELDLRFVEVHVKGVLPDFNIDDIKTRYNGRSITDYLQEVLPLHHFHFKGFAIINAADDTPRCIVEEIRNSIINRNNDSYISTFQEIKYLLQSLVGSNKIEFGMLPFLELNGELLDYDIDLNSDHPVSMLLNMVKERGFPQKEVMSYLEKLRLDPQLIIIDSEEDAQIEQIYSTMFQDKRIGGFAIVPIQRENRMIGILEIVASDDVSLLDFKVISYLDQAIPWIAELLNKAIADFNDSLNQCVKREFTALQPSIEWRVNEVASKYLMLKFKNLGKVEIEPIVFENVYPFYGAIDIKGSSLERNKAIQKDFKQHFTYLLELLFELKKCVNLQIIDEKISCSIDWIHNLNEFVDQDSERRVYHFLENEVYDLLYFIKNNFNETNTLIDKYFEFTRLKQGNINRESIALDKSIQIINSKVAEKLKVFEEKLQECFPCYFESYRTDGLEYDIYLGQSIAPMKRFHPLLLKEFRLQQLIFMIEMAVLTNSLLPTMEVQLETTQLILMNDRSIDICFRKDEKKIDVEGAYNIRHQIIKKRIDKVCIKGTGERLAQPGKVSIIYFNQETADEYHNFIIHLQKQQYLNKEIEFLELEQLQGINGLKAIRVSVSYEADKKLIA